MLANTPSPTTNFNSVGSTNSTLSYCSSNLDMSNANESQQKIYYNNKNNGNNFVDQIKRNDNMGQINQMDLGVNDLINWNPNNSNMINMNGYIPIPKSTLFKMKFLPQLSGLQKINRPQAGVSNMVK